ncbi:MAG: glucose-6-phosphate dehydrogenase assembly protein OpcA [Actinomycetaceae bacterium]|nr:glucose-6-phosphate dehydrogenase assembly protein OpcA [Actinomycetaceae bacterium]
MISVLECTSTADVAAEMEKLSCGAASGFGRVMNLIAVIPHENQIDDAIEICGAASREHPCRVIIVVESPESTDDSLTAQIHYGDEIGPSEVIVLLPGGQTASELDTLVMPLLLADTPIVVYWPQTPPLSPIDHPLGSIATRRITDSRSTEDAIGTLRNLARVHTNGDSDLSWAGVTLWRGLLAAMLDEKPRRPIDHVEVVGCETHPSGYLIAVWLRSQLDVPVHFQAAEVATVCAVRFLNQDGTELALTREDGSSVAKLHRPNLPTTNVNLPRRSLSDCLMEDLRRLDPDEHYGEIIRSDLNPDEISTPQDPASPRTIFSGKRID